MQNQLPVLSNLTIWMTDNQLAALQKTNFLPEEIKYSLIYDTQPTSYITKKLLTDKVTQAIPVSTGQILSQSLTDVPTVSDSHLLAD